MTIWAYLITLAAVAVGMFYTGRWSGMEWTLEKLASEEAERNLCEQERSDV